MVETRRVANHTATWRGAKWQIPRSAIRPGLPSPVVAEPQTVGRQRKRFKPAPGQSHWMSSFRGKRQRSPGERIASRNRKLKAHETAESACGSKEFNAPFPVSPSGGKPGRAGSPHAGSTLRASKSGWHVSMLPAPPTRGAAAPLWIPRERALHRQHRATKTGTFYLAKNRNFLLGLDTLGDLDRRACPCEAWRRVRLGDDRQRRGELCRANDL
jgi:hypothetical protein